MWHDTSILVRAGSAMLMVVATLTAAASASGVEAESAGKLVQIAQAETQAPAAGAGSGFEEIIVTARKREEQVQTVPISITAFSQEMLQAKGIETIQDLRFASPSVYIATDSFRSDTVNITIRGLRNFGSDGIQYDTAASVYVDGVLYARTQGLTGAIYDVDHVEVLKGPQGTLVGRNSTGGAVLYTTKEPTDLFGGFLNLTAGNYFNKEVTGAINIPIDEKLAVRIAGNYAYRQGYVENLYYNPATGARNDTAAFGYRKAGGRIEVKLAPTDDLKIILRADTSEEHDTGSTYHDLGYYVGSVAATNNRPSICNIPGTCTTATAAAGTGFTDLYGTYIAPYYFNGNPASRLNTDPRSYNALLNSFQREQSNFWTTDQFQNNSTVGHFNVLSGTVQQSFDTIDVKLLGADRWFDTANTFGSRGDPYTVNQGNNVLPLYQAWNSELTVNGTQFDDRLKWTTGLFYFTESNHSRNCYLNTSGAVSTFCGGLFSLNFPVLSSVTGHQDTTTNPNGTSRAENTSYAYYLQGTYTVLPDLNFTAGARYTIDEREAATNSLVDRFPATAATTAATKNAVFIPGPVVLNGLTYQGQTLSCGTTDLTGVPLPIGQCASDISHTFRKFTWTLDVDYNLFDKTLAYATTRKGYRAGVINGANANTALDIAQPETVQDYEVGVKSDWVVAGMPIRTNADIYDTQYHDIQTVVSLPYVVFASVPGAGSAPSAPCTQAAFNNGQCVGTQSSDITVNAKSARIYGAEWDFSIKPTPPLTLSFGGSYLHAYYTDFTYDIPIGYLAPAAEVSGLNNTPFPLPQLQVAASATYVFTGEDLGLPVDEVSISGDLYNQSHFLGSTTGYSPAQTDPAGYTFINFRLNVQNIGNSNASLSAFVTNAFNRAACQPEGGSSTSGAGAGVLNSVPNATFGTANTSLVTQCIPLPPRMFGATIKYVF